MLVLFFLRYRQRPLGALGGLGLWVATPGAMILAWLLTQKLAGEAIGGRALLLAGVMLVLVGLQFVVSGLIGEVMMRIYYEGGAGRQYQLQEDAEPA